MLYGMITIKSTAEQASGADDYYQAAQSIQAFLIFMSTFNFPCFKPPQLTCTLSVKDYKMNELPPKEQWFRLSEEKNAIDYLEKATFFIKESSANHNHWKWVIIGLHGALYGFAIAACRGTDSRSVLTKKGRLISFWQALKRCQDPNHMKMFIHSKHLVLSEKQKDSIESLKSEFRNEFEHFKPKGWSIEVHGMPEIAIDVLEVIRFLAFETNTYVHLNDNEHKLVEQLIDDSIDPLKKSELYKEYLLGRKLYKDEASDNQ